MHKDYKKLTIILFYYTFIILFSYVLFSESGRNRCKIKLLLFLIIKKCKI